MEPTTSVEPVRASTREVERVLGAVRGREPGPTLICVGGMHGNEPAGVRGLERVLERLEGRDSLLRGELVALVGNRAALARGARYVDLDLNRMWTEGTVRHLTNGGPPGAPRVEEVELRELLTELDAAGNRARGRVYFLDLHTTSGAGGSFSTVGDTLRNREFALVFPAPLVLGLEELVEGTLLEFLDNRGHVAAAFESGQHEDPASVDTAEAAIWVAMHAAGLIEREDFPEIDQARARLRAQAKGLPRALEMRYRHAIEDGDGFEMKPGYKNFQRVTEGEVVARNRHGDVRVPETARLLMPLYQKQGNDGFFVVREFSRFWLSVSTLLRKLQVDRLLPLLPGISRDPERPDALVANRVVARWFALQFFHLFGYRKQLEEGRQLVVVRRRFDD